MAVLKPGGFDATVQRQKEKPEERTLEIFGVLNVKSYRSRSRRILMVWQRKAVILAAILCPSE